MEQKPLLVQRLARWGAAAYRENKLPFLASLIWGLLAYTFAFTNKLINHDEASQLFAKGATVSSGRWGLSILDHVLPNYSMPWIYGVMTIVLVACAICLIIRMCRIQSRLVQVLLCGAIMVFPSLIGLFGYMFTSSSYGVAFLCAVGAVWCIRQKKLWFAIPALALMGFSLSIYQGYVSLAAGMLVVLLMQDLLLGTEALTAMKRGVWYVAFLAVAMGAYYAATQILLRLLGTGFNEYAAEAVTFRLGELPARVLTAYTSFGEFFTQGLHALVPTALSRAAHILLLLACGALLILWLVQKKDAPVIALLLALAAILPLAVNCMYLITSADSIHTLTLYGFVSLYVLAAVLLDTFLSGTTLLHRAALNLGIAALALVVCINTYVANEAYLHLHLRYENAYAFYTALAADLQGDPEFDPGTKLAVVGNYQSPDFYQQNFPFLPELTGVMGFLPDVYSYGDFLEYYIGLPLPIASAEEVAAVAATQEFKDMPVYPYHGSTGVIDGIFVVKLS